MVRQLAVTVIFLLMSLPICFFISLFGFFLYGRIVRKFDINRDVRQETGSRHIAKRHIPDTAGIVMIFVIFFLAFLDGMLEYYANDKFIIKNIYLFPLLFGIIGFADDVVKNRFKNSKGIPARFRILLQFVIAVFMVNSLGSGLGENVESDYQLGSIVNNIFVIIFILISVNAANFTDGLDGLLSSVSLIITAGLIILSVIYGKTPHGIIHLWWLGGLLAAFLIFNWHPAKMFMGDGGSMLIGGFISYIAVSTGLIWVILIMALPMYLELISVVLQVISFRLTGRRIFPMTPIHHSFEKWGWHEKKIVWLFIGVTTFTTILGIFISWYFKYPSVMYETQDFM